MEWHAGSDTSKLLLLSLEFQFVYVKYGCRTIDGVKLIPSTKTLINIFVAHTPIC
jgi:hypothetical protein